MTPAVANLALAKGTAYDVALVIQDAAAQPIDLAGFTLEASIRAASDAAPVDLAVIVTDAAAGLATVRIPAQPLGMGAWELWMQAAPETPRERALRGLVTVSETVDPREKENPSSHRLIVRISDTVTVIVDAVDLAWWAYTRAVKAQLETASLAATWPQTVSNGEQAVNTAKNDALDALQNKQADAVLAVGRAQKTATDKIAGAQTAAVSAVQAAGEEAKETIEPLVRRAENAKEAIDQVEGRINTAATNAATFATSAANSATAAQQALAAIPQVDSSGNMTLPGNITAAGGTFDGTVNANGGVRVPAPATASNALSMDAILRELARMDWVRLRGGYECVFSGPIEYLTRMMSLNQKHSGYASLSEAVLNNCLYRVVQLAPSSGVSFLGLVSAPWKMGGLLGTSKDTSRAGAVGWLIDNADAASVCLGTTGQGYSFETNKTSQCYAHPVHWNNSSSALWTDYRLPYYHSVNSSSAKDPCPGFQVTIYGKNYLGSQSSCLVRGTDYGREAENTQYIWALVPKVTNLVVAMAPRDAENDHAYVMNRWELFVNGSYVMPMTAGFCGTGHTACVQETVKAHEVSSAVRVGLRMQGVLVNQGRLPSSETALNQLGAVIQDDVTARPVPVVEASALEVDAGGGEVALSISSPLNEAVYVLNDTMCGHDSTAVWCSQSAESTEAGGGEVVLTLAANESGEARQVWAFVGHHYAQAAVIKINQSA